MVRRWVVMPLAVYYLLVLTAGGVFHQHGHVIHAPHQVASAAPCDHDHHHDSSTSQNSHDSDEHGSCSICRFLAQAPIATPAVEVRECVPLATEVSTARPIRLATATLSIWQIRAPPHAV